MPDFLVNTPEGQRFKVSVPDFSEPAPPAGAESMTHQAEAPNPAAPYVKGVKDFAAGGISGVMKGQGSESPVFDNPVATALQSESANAALGVINPAGRLSVAANPRVIRSHLDQMMEGVRYEQQRYDRMLREGQLSPENHRLATERLEREVQEQRTRLGLPAQSQIRSISAVRPEPLQPRPLNELMADRRSAGYERLSEEMRSNEGRPLPGPGAIQPKPAAPREGILGGDTVTRGQFHGWVQSKGIMEKEFADNYFGGAYDPSITMMRVTDTANGKGLEFDGALRIQGKRIGSINREIFPDEGVAMHNLLRVDKGNAGFVKQMTAKQFEIYERLGIERAELLADIDVGSYAWARYGWLPTAKEWSEGLSDKMWMRLPTLRYLDNSVRANVEKLLQNPDPRHIWTISDLDLPVYSSRFGNTTLGKALLLDNEWQGTFNLKDDAQMGRFKTYVGQAQR